MTYCVVQINCLPLPRFFKEVTIKTAEGRYEETWNSYLELLNKDPRASLKVLLVQKGDEEEKTKRALKVLGKLNRNKSEKQTPPAQETETTGNNNNAETEGSHSQADKLHLPSGPQAHYRTEWVDRGETLEMEEGHVQADNENHKEKARPDGSRQDDTAKDGEI